MILTQLLFRMRTLHPGNLWLFPHVVICSCYLDILICISSSIIVRSIKSNMSQNREWIHNKRKFGTRFYNDRVSKISKICIVSPWGIFFIWINYGPDFFHGIFLFQLLKELNAENYVFCFYLSQSISWLFIYLSKYVFTACVLYFSWWTSL